MPGRLVNKNTIVTGGGAGIGLAIARLFGQEGAKITIFDRDRSLAEKAKQELLANDIDVDAYCVDVSDAEAIDSAFKNFSGRYGTVHVLVNNAGIAEFSGIEETSLESWQKILAVNLTGTFLCSRGAIPLMKAEGGSIINISSIAGLIGIPKMPAYCASKAAVIGLTRQLAVEYAARGIRANCICPGRISGTDLDHWILEKDGDEITRQKVAKYPIGRFGRAEEVAQSALFLAGDESNFITGTTLTIDGGMTVI